MLICSTALEYQILRGIYIGLSDSQAIWLEFFFKMSRSLPRVLFFFFFSPRVLLSKIVQGWSGQSRGYRGCWKNLFISLLSSFLPTSHSSLFSLFFIIFFPFTFYPPPHPFGSIVLSSFSPKYSRNDQLFYTSPSSQFLDSYFALILINVLKFFKLEVDHTSFLFLLKLLLEMRRVFLRVMGWVI